MSQENNTNNIAVISNNLDNEVQNRILYLHDVIDDNSVLEIIQKINEINLLDEEEERNLKIKYDMVTVKRKPIILDISSFGGIVYSGLTLVSTIEQSITPIITRVNGYAMSMGLIIFLAGHERYMSRHASIMYHQISSGIIGKLKDQEEDLEISKDLQNHLEEYVIERTNLKKKDLKKIYDSKQDYYINAKEALVFGIATKII